ncbi:MAG: hypothetical protein ACP5KY_08270, partial [Thermoproteus sp.]
MLAVAFLILVLALGVYVSPSPSPPGVPTPTSGQPSGGIYDVPVLGQVAAGLKAVGEALGNAIQLSTVGADVGIGAVIGYTSTSGESQVFTEYRYSGVLMSGVGVMNPMAGIAVKPDKPGYKALKLYDPDTNAEGEIWFQPIVSTRIINGTPTTHNFTVTAKSVIQCDDEPPVILSFNRERRGGVGGPPPRLEFQRVSTRGAKVFGELMKATAKGKGSVCTVTMMVDYDAEVKFEGDDEPVRKSLSNVVLGRFEIRRATRAGDFEFSLISNATVRPLAEIMVGGQSGYGSAQTVTYTETRVMVTTV